MAGHAPGPKGDRDEGQAEREEDLQQMPDHSPAWPRHGHLHRPEAQAAPGLERIGRTAAVTGPGPVTAAPGRRPGPVLGRDGTRCARPPPREGELPAHGTFGWCRPPAREAP